MGLASSYSDGESTVRILRKELQFSPKVVYWKNFLLLGEVSLLVYSGLQLIGKAYHVMENNTLYSKQLIYI